MRGVLESACFEPRRIPEENLPEIVVAGRSNVGKSSLINALLGAKLAHVGATPGKTRSINFYKVDDEVPFRLVDLPGYGYAARSKGERNSWLRLIGSYMKDRSTIRAICHLVDFRHGLLANDRELQEWLNGTGLDLMVVFTKADKIARGKRRAMLEQYVRDGLFSVDMPIITSSEKRDGIDELRNFIRRRVSD